MGKKNKKSAEHKERVAAKQSKKAAQKEKRHKTKGRDADSDAEDIDLDAILAQYAEEQAKFLKVTEVVSGPPSPRTSATILASPSNRNELLIFGGEHFDGTLATFFNNLFVYNIDRDEWKEVTSPNSPLPRSGHAWCRGGNAGGVYLFGGEPCASILDEFILTVAYNVQVNFPHQSRGRSIITMTFGISTLPPENGLVSKPKAKAHQLEVATE